jgi:hypothetical protein
VSEFIVTWQVPVPEHPPPLHPAKNDPDDGVAVRVTCEAAVYACEHVDGQEIPPEPSDTLPLPDPDRDTVSVRVTGTRASSASPLNPVA